MIKSVLITGAAKRIGRQMALDLADDGWDVAVHCDKSLEDAMEVALLIRAKGRNAAAVKGFFVHHNFRPFNAFVMAIFAG